MVSGGYGTPSAKISLETITSVSQYFCRLSTPATMLSNADPAPAPSGANSSFASRLPKSSSKIPSYCRESLRFAKSSVLSTVANPFPAPDAARSAPLRTCRTAAWSPDIIGSVLFHTPAVPRAPTCPKPLRRSLKSAFSLPFLN